MMTKDFKLGNLLINSESNTIVIAEAAVEHLGNLNVAMRMADAAKAVGVDIIKYQMHIPESEMLPNKIKFWGGSLDEILENWDKSDKYLKNRRKAISKNIKKSAKDDVEMNPKKKTEKSVANAEMPESTIPPIYAKILENRAMHTKGATPPETMDDKYKGDGDDNKHRSSGNIFKSYFLREINRIVLRFKNLQLCIASLVNFKSQGKQISF